MIRKLIAAVIIALVLFTGCTEKKPELPENYSAYVLVNDKTDSALIVISDTDGKILYQSGDILYPKDVYFGQDGVYYSADGRHYSSLLFDSLKPGKDIDTAKGGLAYYREGHIRVEFDYTSLLFYKADELLFTKPMSEVQAMMGIGDKIYIIDGSDALQVYDSITGSLLQETASPFANRMEYVGIVETGENVYVISENGYTRINEDGSWGRTYLFTVDVADVEGAKGSYIAVITNGEEAFYRVSFDEYSLKMQEVFDDYFTSNRDFARIFADLYQKGYTVCYGEEYLR